MAIGIMIVPEATIVPIITNRDIIRAVMHKSRGRAHQIVGATTVSHCRSIQHHKPDEFPDASPDYHYDNSTYQQKKRKYDSSTVYGRHPAHSRSHYNHDPHDGAQTHHQQQSKRARWDERHEDVEICQRQPGYDRRSDGQEANASVIPPNRDESRTLFPSGERQFDGSPPSPDLDVAHLPPVQPRPQLEDRVTQSTTDHQGPRTPSLSPVRGSAAGQRERTATPMRFAEEQRGYSVNQALISASRPR